MESTVIEASSASTVIADDQRLRTDVLHLVFSEVARLEDATLPRDFDHNNWEEYIYEYGKWYLHEWCLRKFLQSTNLDMDHRSSSTFFKTFEERTNLFDSLYRFCRIPDHIDRAEFLKRKFVESCFIVELFRKYAVMELRGPDDPIFNMPGNLHEVRRDLIEHHDKLPPFSALVDFFKAIQDDPQVNRTDPRDHLIHLALLFFENWVGHPLKPPPNNPIQSDENRDLVDLVHKALSVPVADETSITMDTEIELHFINYATELQEAGVKFKRMEGNNLVIKFENGVLEIPPIKVAEKTTLFLLQKLMAYESCRFPDSHRRNVNDYVKFIQCLINSANDVELLRRSGIIENYLGNDQLIFKTLTELGDKSKISRNFTYSGIFTKVNEHCRHRRNVWMAKLWKNYFNSPWSFISFLAAVVLLLLTLTQTLFSILSYHPS